MLVCDCVRGSVVVQLRLTFCLIWLYVVHLPFSCGSGVVQLCVQGCDMH